MSIFAMPPVGDPKQVSKLVLEPVMHPGRFSKHFGRMLWKAKVYSVLYEEPVHITNVAFTAGGAAHIAELWMRENGYYLGSRLGRSTTLG